MCRNWQQGCVEALLATSSSQRKVSRGLSREKLARVINTFNGQSKFFNLRFFFFFFFFNRKLFFNYYYLILITIQLDLTMVAHF